MSQALLILKTNLSACLTSISNVPIIVNRGDWLGSPANIKVTKKDARCQDLCWKVHDPAQSFVFPSYTVHELRNQHFSIG